MQGESRWRSSSICDWMRQRRLELGDQSGGGAGGLAAAAAASLS